MPKQEWSINTGEAYAGEQYGLATTNSQRLTYSTDAEMSAYGLAVVQGAKSNTIKVGLTEKGSILGITMRELTRAYTDAQIAGGIGALPARDNTVMTMGVIWVSPAVAVAKDDPVYVVKESGLFTNVAGTDNILISNAKFVSTAVAGARAKISLVIGG